MPKDTLRDLMDAIRGIQAWALYLLDATSDLERKRATIEISRCALKAFELAAQAAKEYALRDKNT